MGLLLVCLGRPGRPMAFTIAANTIEASISQYTLSNTSFRLDSAHLDRAALLVGVGAEFCQTHRENPPDAQNKTAVGGSAVAARLQRVGRRTHPTYARNASRAEAARRIAITPAPPMSREASTW